MCPLVSVSFKKKEKEDREKKKTNCKNVLKGVANSNVPVYDKKKKIMPSGP